jgi:cytochrome b561
MSHRTSPELNAGAPESGAAIATDLKSTAMAAPQTASSENYSSHSGATGGRESAAPYDRLSKTLHWLSAVLIPGLFGVGVWMVELNYYSPWYKTAPQLHKSVGLILLALTAWRLLWRLLGPRRMGIAGHKSWEKRAALLTHWGLYGLLLFIMMAGILIATADGRGIWLFDWFELPALPLLFEQQADIAGTLHKYAAYALMALVVIHVAAALKHHFVDKDSTLTNMINSKKGPAR